MLAHPICPSFKTSVACRFHVLALLLISLSIENFSAAGDFDVPEVNSTLQDVQGFREKQSCQILKEFRSLLKYPNSTQDRANVLKLAKHLVKEFQQRGVETKLLRLPNANPLIYGELKSPGAKRTLMIYAHYDGQPVVPSRWKHGPWEPVLYSKSMQEGGRQIPWPKPGQKVDPESRIYGRSSSDDKGAIFAILKTLDALKKTNAKRTCNLKFLFDGEEEAGSPNLRRYLENHKQLFDGDLWLFCDGPVHQSGRPTLAFGVRGISSMEITVYGARRNLHSGHYGNWAPNPALNLAKLLSSMKDEKGNVLVEGYYDSVLPISSEENQAIGQIPIIDRELRRKFGLAQTENENELFMKRLLLPSLNIKGFSSGSVGDSARNIIPNTATASLDLRLVKGNDPRRMLQLVEAHIEKQGFHLVRKDPDQRTRLKYSKIAKVISKPSYPAIRTEMDHPLAVKIAQAASLAGNQPVVKLPTLGGSLPLYLFTDYLSQPLVIVPIANFDNNQHAPNENLRIGNLWYGIDLFATIFTME